MANAKKCDICGCYYDVEEDNPYKLDYDEQFNMVRMHRARDSEKKIHVGNCWLHFDTCETCYQDVLDYILTKKAASEPIAK